MTRGQKTFTAMALLALFFLGTGFGGEPGGGGGTGDDDLPPMPETPCPPGFHYRLDRSTLTWECVADEPATPDPLVPVPPDEPEVIELPEEPPAISDDPDDWIKNYPGGDSFFQSVLGDQFFGQGANSGSITWRYLATEAHRAAVEVGGLDVAAANAFAAKVANNPDNRRDALNLICCAPYNDACYGTWGYDPEKDPKPALNGRVIRLGPQNFDNAQRIRDSEPMGRCVRVGSPQTKGDKSGVRAPGAVGCTHHELLWMPKVDRAKLWNSAKNSASGRAVIDPTPETWPDGSSRMDPPPFIATRGVFFAAGSNTANVKVWGCAQIHTVEI